MMVNPQSNEYLIAAPKGIRTSRTIFRVPPSERWNINFLNQIRGGPWDWNPKDDEEDAAKAEPKEGKEGPEMPEGAEEVKRRYPQGQRVRIAKADVR